MKIIYMKIVYELKIAQRYFESEGLDVKALFLRSIHNSSSMFLSGKTEEEIMEYLKGFFENIKGGEEFYREFITYIYS